MNSNPLKILTGAVSSAGRAPGLHPGGRQFETVTAHQQADAGAMKLEYPATMGSHVQKVLGGEYNIPYRHSAPVILDIGANVGSFAAWALKRWPGCHVHCYEPLPDSFALLTRNLGQFAGSSVSLNNFAVGDPSLTRTLPWPQQLRRSELLRYRRAIHGLRRGRDQGAGRPAQGSDREDRYRRL